MKIIHIVENLHRGAVETWLVEMFEESRNLGATDEWTFYCALGKPGRHDERVRKLGGHILFSPVPFGRTTMFLRALRKTLGKGRFDILHCHHDLINGFYLMAALGIPMRRRIAHVHNTDEALPTPSRWKHWLLKEPLRRTCFGFADGVVANSRHALQTFLAGREPRRGRDDILYYGCDFSEFLHSTVNPLKLKSELGFPQNVRLVLFLGRMVPLKNPLGALDGFDALCQRRNDVACLFVGQGDLEENVSSRAAHLGLSDRVRLLGWRDNPGALMQACDLFLFPRLENNIEAFGLAVIEAQAAGLPILISNGVSEEVVIFPNRCRQLPLSEGPQAWAAAADELLQIERATTQEIIVALAGTPFPRTSGARNLLKLYASPANR